MLTPQDNELLCRIENNAAMGRMMRRHWIPACMSQELPEPGGEPIRVRLLGECLVAFRDPQGQVGILAEACPHRRASLLYARNEDGGLRCLYHGWKFSRNGTIVDMPSEPPGSNVATEVKQRAYPVKEAGGMVWAYMGEAQSEPVFDPPVFTVGGNVKLSISKVIVDANWAQVIEGGIDSSHSSSLHSDEMRSATGLGSAAVVMNERHGVSGAFTINRPSVDKAPRLKVQITDYGMRYVAMRHPIGQADTHEYARVTVYIAPFTLLTPPNASFSLVQYVTPMDDTHTMFHFVAWSDDSLPGHGIDQEVWRARSGSRVGIDVDKNYRNLRTLENRHLQDRQAMKEGSFSGIRGTGNQDIAMWESMGSITDRTDEWLVSGDVAVARYRRMMVTAVRAFDNGEPAIGAGSAPVFSEIRAFEGVIPKTQDWHSLGLGPVPEIHPDKAIGF